MSYLSNSTPIGDGVCEPTSLTDLSSTFAWNQDVIIIVGLSPAARVRGVNRFFLQYSLNAHWITS